MRSAAIALFLAAALTGCASWLPDANRIPVQQGNALTAADLAKLHTGLPRDRVRELIGTPIQQTPFHKDRWDYVYYAGEAGRDLGDPQRLTLYFNGETLARIVDRYEPPEKPAATVQSGRIREPEAGQPKRRQPMGVPGQGQPGQPGRLPSPGS